MKEHQRVVLAFAAFIALLVLASAYFTDHNGDIDELGLYNPSYMLARYGRLTYPAHGYFDEPVIVHPPIHVGEIGLLMRAGMTWHYAEATPALFFFLLATLLAARLPAPAMVRLSFLFSIGFMAFGGEFLLHRPAPWGLLFGTRPEGEVFSAWLCGLLLMETGRLLDWNRTRLFFGAFLMAWAASIHYFAWASLAGVFVYVVLAVIHRGWRPAVATAGALLGGACAFGIPYLVFYLIPNLTAILQIVQEHRGSGGIGTSIQAHQQWYRIYAPIPLIVPPLRAAFWLGIPLFVLSTAVMWVSRATRAIAMGALPLLLAIYFLTPHKQFSYLMPEVYFFLAAGCMAILAACGWLAARTGSAALQRAFPAAAAVALGSYFLIGTDVVQGVAASTEPEVQEGEVARAAGRAILGPGAKVTGRMGMWYVAGASYWHNIQWDILAFPDSYDPVRYLSNFDAAVDHWHSSELTRNGGSTLSAMYSAGLLKLRGFYFGESNPELQYVLLGLQPAPRLTGYAMNHGQLHRFEEQPEGDYEMALSMCPSAPRDAYKQLRKASAMYALIGLPGPSPHGLRLLLHLLAPRGSAPPANWIAGCTPVRAVRGKLTAVDKWSMIADLRREDPPIQFAYGLEDLPGYRETGVPARMASPKEGVRLTHVLARPPKPLVTTPSGMGSFALSIPAEHGDAVNIPCWVTLRLKVTRGRIGLIVWSNKNQDRKDAGAFLGPTQQPVEVAVPLPRLSNSNLVTIYNAGLERPSQVEVLDAAVVVSPADWTKNQAALAGVR